MSRADEVVGTLLAATKAEEVGTDEVVATLLAITAEEGEGLGEDVRSIILGIHRIKALSDADIS